MSTAQTLPASFRDPSGSLFRTDDTLYRQVNTVYREDYEHLMDSGLYQALVDKGLLVSHTEVQVPAPAPGAWKVLQPAPVPFITYPYEWTFHQLRAAALLTLEVQTIAFAHGMVLKDASAYNVQFLGAAPVFIDTLSFQRYTPGEPWVAYRQFCQHFLAPLVLMAYCDDRLTQLSMTNIDGLPLDLAAGLLPWRAKLRPAIYTHLVLHARTQAKWADAQDSAVKARPRVSELGFRGLVDNLQGLVRSLQWRQRDTEWGDYYADTNYDDAAMNAKRELVDQFLGTLGQVPVVVDAGANTGEFSKVAEAHADLVVSMDIDPVAVDRHFRVRCDAPEQRRQRVLPMRIDLTNPSPAIGWDNRERDSIADRCADSVVMALALVHHLAIGNNVPLDRVAGFFHGFARHLVLEFVPKSDSQVRRLLATREDVFPDYTEDGFEAAIAPFFRILRKEAVSGSERTLYLLERC